MTVKITTPDGRTISVLDMIDTDLSRLAENYNQQMAGRSALAAAGVGGDDAGIQALAGVFGHLKTQGWMRTVMHAPVRSPDDRTSPGIAPPVHCVPVELPGDGASVSEHYAGSLRAVAGG